jgi:hypothetical protein
MRLLLIVLPTCHTHILLSLQIFRTLDQVIWAIRDQYPPASLIPDGLLGLAIILERRFDFSNSIPSCDTDTFFE